MNAQTTNFIALANINRYWSIPVEPATGPTNLENALNGSNLPAKDCYWLAF